MALELNSENLGKILEDYFSMDRSKNLRVSDYSEEEWGKILTIADISESYKEIDYLAKNVMEFAMKTKNDDLLNKAISIIISSKTLNKAVEKVYTMIIHDQVNVSEFEARKSPAIIALEKSGLVPDILEIIADLLQDEENPYRRISNPTHDHYVELVC